MRKTCQKLVFRNVNPTTNEPINALLGMFNIDDNGEISYLGHDRPIAKFIEDKGDVVLADYIFSND
jgi:hypothetical protein